MGEGEGCEEEMTESASKNVTSEESISFSEV
jgi:hypothetical protein